jgi:uncharacterized protein YbbC (DUF1343 family)
MIRITLLIIATFIASAASPQIMEKLTRENPNVICGAARTSEYFGLLAQKNVVVVANQTSVIGETHLVDSLITSGINVVKVFAPEHGFRGKKEAGETIKNGSDVKTGIPIISLYGSKKKPASSDLDGVDVILFDIQDVGARFYTYLSSMHYVMEAAAENSIPVIVLDRPNPNGFYIDGPVLNPSFSSFVGMHPIPIVHGMTLGELAKMINGEGWLKNGIHCELQVILCGDYTHLDLYELPIKPSPNLPNMGSVYLYPSLCLFEGTVVSIGRGTETPFQVIGHPKHEMGTMTFKPESISGVAENPKYKGETCKGHNLQEFGNFYFTTGRQLYLDWLIALYESYPDKSAYFKDGSWFDRLAGTDELRKQIIAGLSSKEIKDSWKKELDEFKLKRAKYILYSDFE